jgi:hypothetical protein
MRAKLTTDPVCTVGFIPSIENVSFDTHRFVEHFISCLASEAC